LKLQYDDSFCQRDAAIPGTSFCAFSMRSSGHQCRSTDTMCLFTVNRPQITNDAEESAAAEGAPNDNLRMRGSFSCDAPQYVKTKKNTE
jgi:hypothetical protein